MKRISMTLVFDLSEYNDNPKKYARIENGLGFKLLQHGISRNFFKSRTHDKNALNLSSKIIWL